MHRTTLSAEHKQSFVYRNPIDICCNLMLHLLYKGRQYQIVSINKYDLAKDVSPPNERFSTRFSVNKTFKVTSRHTRIPKLLCNRWKINVFELSRDDKMNHVKHLPSFLSNLRYKIPHIRNRSDTAKRVRSLLSAKISSANRFVRHLSQENFH